MASEQEAVTLEGGGSNALVQRVGDTVCRTQTQKSAFVHELLALLENRGFEYAPKFLGIDDENRVVLTFIEGEIINGDVEDEKLLYIATKILREYHDATTNCTLAGNKEVVCHNDFAPWNIIFKDNTIVGVIDYDGAEPGNRVDDIAYMVWTFLGLRDASKTDWYLKQIREVASIYGDFDRASFSSALLKHQVSTLAMRKDKSKNEKTKEARDFNTERANRIEREIRWTRENLESIASVLS